MDDPCDGWGSDSGSSGLDAHMVETYLPDSEEAEVREAEVRAEYHAACAQNRAHAEINAAYSAARAAADGTAAGALERAVRAREVAYADWHLDWFCESLISDYEIERLHNIVANEQGLLDLDLIPSSQLSLSNHTLAHNVDQQCIQLSRIVATEAIAHAIRDYYVEQYPALVIDV